ncbi:MAG: tRNA 2-thiouridine(34) synthase MnmA, partial [Bacteroidales bacterium]|nr:tRNA 2-thiouridine(34) synthase MnmA [Bacteroidales bacterium]
MSGGIDSSVSALMLLDKYEITGATFRTYDSMKESCIAREKGCCTIESIMEAKRFAQSLGIEHHIVDFHERFAETVISNFVSEYLHGRTPNPCVVCNREIKWGVMLQKADELGCEYIATGHYARIMHENGRYFLRKGVDLSKDQTYFLWRLSQENLARTVFPLGEYTKDQIRAIADEKGFKALVKKRESQE